MEITETSSKFFAFVVPGDPQQQGSMRSARNGRMFSANKKLKPWRSKVAKEAEKSTVKFDQYEPVFVEACFVVKRPISVSFLDRSLPSVTPDLDKFQRALGDALTESGIIYDDGQIVAWRAQKEYDDECPEGVYVKICSCTVKR